MFSTESDKRVKQTQQLQESLRATLSTYEGVKNALVMWPVRIAASGTAVTPGGAVEVLLLLGKEEALKRIESGRQRLSAALS